VNDDQEFKLQMMQELGLKAARVFEVIEIEVSPGRYQVRIFDKHENELDTLEVARLLNEWRRSHPMLRSDQ
jgi:hypothetical protein